MVGPHELHEGGAAARDGLKGDELGKPLNGVGDVRGHAAEAFTRKRAEAIDAPAQEERRQADVEEEGQECERGRPGQCREGCQHRGGHEQRHQRRGDRVRVEIFDRLHVLGGKPDEVARAAAQQVGRRQGIELGEKCDAHVRQQAVRHVVGEPGFEPMQHARERRQQC